MKLEKQNRKKTVAKEVYPKLHNNENIEANP